MRIGVAAIAAGVMVAVATGCSSTAAEAPPAPTVSAVVPSVTPTPTVVPTVSVAAEAIADLMASEPGVMGPESADATRFVAQWWASLPEARQAAVCSQWTGLNVVGILRKHVAYTEWATEQWNTTGLRLALMESLDDACIG